MDLPALRLPFLRGWPTAALISGELREALLGRVIALPAALGEPEREAIVDAAALLLDLPARPLATTASAPPGAVYVLPTMVDAPPSPVTGALVLCVVRRAGPPRLSMPPEVRLLRDGIIEHWGLQHSGTPLQWIAAWMGTTTDSPGTAIRFAGAALARQLAVPDADEAALYLAGLASTIGWLLRGVDARVAQWVLAIAAQAPDAGRVVSTEAALLGRDAALLRAFEAGLLQILPEEPEERLALRRPLEALSELADAPGAPSLAAAAAALAPHLSPEVHLVLERLLRPATRKLGLEGPPPPRPLVGREEVLQRLVTLCEPAREVRTTILYGLDGMGKSAVAASLCELLAPRLTPVWVRFAEGAEAGWLRVAMALGLDVTQRGLEMRDRSGVPRWARRIHDILRQGPYLLVIEDAEAVSEDELPAWLPSGEGACVVLVLSRGAQRPLQRMHDAIAVRLGPLPLEAARSLLASKVPRLAEAIGRGEADRLIEALGRNPSALGLSSALLEKAGLEEATEVATRGGQAVPEVLRDALGRLSPEEQRMIEMLAVCAPAGSPPELPLATLSVHDAREVLSSLQDHSFVLSGGHLVRLDPLVRVESERRIREAEREPILHMEHAQAVHRVLSAMDGRTTSGEVSEILDNALLAVGRLSERCEGGEREHIELLLNIVNLVYNKWQRHRPNHLQRLANTLDIVVRLSAGGERKIRTRALILLGLVLTDHPGDDRHANLLRAVTASEDALAEIPRSVAPILWAKIQNNLGNALSVLAKESEAAPDYLDRAVAAHRAALTVFTREEHPQEWASTLSNLGNDLYRLPSGAHEDNIRQAIDCQHAALKILDRTTHPFNWATTQNNLGNALSELFALGDKQSGLAAIQAYESALAILTRDETPEPWAMTQGNLANVLVHLPSGDRAENLRRAAEAYHAALTVFTADQYPADNASLQRDLDDTLAALSALAHPQPTPKPPPA